MIAVSGVREKLAYAVDVVGGYKIERAVRERKTRL